MLGGGSEAPARTAGKLYRENAAKRIFFTSSGGRFGGNIVFGCHEVARYADILHEMRVPDSRVHYPDITERTTNTLMEAQIGGLFMRTVMGSVDSVILCSRPIHQRRAWATFRKQNPVVPKWFNQPCEEDLTIEHLPRLVQEVDRLQIYAKKGDIEEQQIPGHVLKTCEEIRKHLNLPAAA